MLSSRPSNHIMWDTYQVLHIGESMEELAHNGMKKRFYESGLS
jgi:hypothetical protein